MDHLTALRIFVRIAESGSFSRAAEDLGLPRASASEAVRRVETRAGARLLNRTTRRVALTADGEAFLERARHLLDQADDLDGLFRQGPDRVSGLLRVSLPERLATHTLMPALPDFLDRFPALNVELSVTDRFVDLIGAGFDCVIRAGTLKDSRLIGQSLGEMALGTFASPAYLATHGTPESPADLPGHRLVGYASSVHGLDFDWDGPDRAVTLTGRLAVDNAEAQVAAALAGLGLIQVPVYGLRRHVAAGTLVEILPGHRPAPLPLTILYPQHRQRSAKVAAFIAWTRATLNDAQVFETAPSLVLSP
ncbi:MAG: LysR family transcriptional regulator [Magnetospirillum gryphiswaldense]|nr:LysR family transcriptional regulator [Magnetospirillum gryphiswaldense]